MKRALRITLGLLLFMGVWFSGELSYNEFFSGSACPKMGNVPACHLVFICFLGPFIAHILNSWHKMFFLLTGLAFALAIFASIGNAIGSLVCPKTEMGVPMCYLSFLLLLGIIWMKYRLVRF